MAPLWSPNCGSRDTGNKCQISPGHLYPSTNNSISVKFVETDVTSWAAQVAALETAIRHAPNHRIDHFIANAGVSGHNLTESMKPNPAGPDSIGPPEPIFTAINVSLIGSYYTLCLASHHFINAPEWKAHSQLDRSVVLLGSMSSYRSIPHGTDYAAAKMGMRGLFTSARETMFLRKLKIRVNMFSPQFIETAMNTQTRQWYERGGYQFGDINDAVTAFLRIVGDTSIRGRSISMNKEGIHDMDDDAGGSDGQVQVQRLLSQGLLPSWNH